ncbi:MAG: Ribosomal RNA small subunit methyltransferase A [Parcubacteria group bacterium GW2011_GWB1_41_4]|nr:MAG: Ribosomal RNA small subunit methyltransferase A [Parcubacteria group bacterium GW2011_GWB1_41_4]
MFYNIGFIKIYIIYMGFAAKKKFGQHFLKNISVVKKIVKALELEPDEVVFEIGPGKGVLTAELLKTKARVVAVEKDRDLIPILQERFGDNKNFELINSDILDFDPRPLIISYQSLSFKVCGNLPFYISGMILELILERWCEKPRLAVFMLQKEVCQKLLAKSGKMTILGVINQLLADFKLLFYVPKESFSPKPKVDAGVLKIVPKKTDIFYKNLGLKEFIKAGFSHPRKFLLNNLSQKTSFDKEKINRAFLKLKISEKLRPEDLEKEIWSKLHGFLVEKHL